MRKLSLLSAYSHVKNNPLFYFWGLYQNGLFFHLCMGNISFYNNGVSYKHASTAGGFMVGRKVLSTAYVSYMSKARVKLEMKQRALS